MRKVSLDSQLGHLENLGSDGRKGKGQEEQTCGMWGHSA